MSSPFNRILELLSPLPPYQRILVLRDITRAVLSLPEQDNLINILVVGKVRLPDGFTCDANGEVWSKEGVVVGIITCNQRLCTKPYNHLGECTRR